MSLTLNGIQARGLPNNITVSGGTVTQDNGYTYHTFTHVYDPDFIDGNLIISGTGGIYVDYLIVGGGGGSVGYAGGGAGGYIAGNTLLNPGTYPVEVGEGSTWFKNLQHNSSFNGLIAYAGGIGGKGDGSSQIDGGSGGGGELITGVAMGGSGISGQGHPGGSTSYDGSYKLGAGGGGGAQTPGGNGDTTSDPNFGFSGDGGLGLQWLDGNYYAGGGAGGTGSERDGDAGIGGGGEFGQNGINGTGGGAGGAGSQGSGVGNSDVGDYDLTGGHGIVIIRYQTT